MPDRKKTPDVMGDLLGEHSTTAQPRPPQPPANQTPPAPDHQDPPPTGATTGPSVTPAPPEPERTKATYYIDTEALNRLELAWFRLRQQVPADARRHISKSLIVETALTVALDDLDADGTTSQLARLILNQ